MISAIHQKLFREVWHLKTQMLSIALVVATGIMTVVTMRGSYESLVIAQQNYYQQTRFADIWVSLRRAPKTLLPHISNLPGVALADARITQMATLDLPGLNAPAIGRFISLPAHGTAILNDIVLRQGRFIDPGQPDEVLINEKFALARQLGPGDSVRAIINGRARDLEVVGTAISPEHMYAVPPGSLMPDDQRYGIIWMSENTLGPAWNLDGAFNEAYVKLSPDADPLAVIDGMNDLLSPYGGLGAYQRRDQPSHLIMQGELDQNRVMGTAIPAVFLGVAVFLLHLVLSRLITTQRGEIAVLKAFGYHDNEVGTHYLMFAMIAVAIGIAIGTLGGIWLGQAYINIYRFYFDIPGLNYHSSWTLMLLAAGISLIGACTGALSAVLKAVRLPPAEAMQPQPPPTFKPGWLERSGFSNMLPASGRMILRSLERKPLQMLLSSLGVAFSVAILVIGFFMFDGVRHLMKVQFQEIQREDVAVNFYQHQSNRVLEELWRMPGVNRVEPIRTTPVRLSHQYLSREVAITGLAADGALRRLVGSTEKLHPLPAQGIVVSHLLAERLQVNVGDTIDVQMLEGQRQNTSSIISGTLDDFMGVNAYMDLNALSTLTGEPGLVSGALLSVSSDQRDNLYQSLKLTPQVASVAAPADMLATFEGELARSLFISVGFLVGFASVIAVGVIYNGARISLSERGRELASLRVMGFHREEVARLLLGEQAIITVCAIPLGWILGYTLAWLVSQSMQTDLYRLPYIINTHTWLYSGIITILAAIASAVAVRRRLDHFDLISVLKTRE